MNKKFVRGSNFRVNAYGGTQLSVFGECQLLCKFKNREGLFLNFIIIRGSKAEYPTVIGSPSIDKLNLIKKIEVINTKNISAPLSVKTLLDKHSKVFCGLGCIKNHEYDIKLKDNVVSSVAKCRKIPLLLKESEKKEIDKMVKEGSLIRISEPSEWAHTIVIVKKKDGSIRICIDPTELNKYILRQNFHLPNIDDIMPGVSSHKFFTVIDGDRAFNQVKLSEKSMKLLTVITLFGRFICTRLYFGINSATEVSHEIFLSIFGDIEGVNLYIDDILISGKSQEEHDLRLKLVLERAEEMNVKFNIKKAHFSKDRVKFFSHYFTSQGLCIDDERVKAILELESPKNKKELERFSGMLVYVARFIPHLSTRNQRLRNWVKKIQFGIGMKIVKNLS